MFPPTRDRAPRPQHSAVLRRARKALGWSQLMLVVKLEDAYRKYGQHPPTRDSLKVYVSRWENGHLEPSEFNRRLLCEVLGLNLVQLGLPIDPDYPWPPPWLAPASGGH